MPVRTVNRWRNMLQVNRRAAALVAPGLLILAGCGGGSAPAAAHPASGARQALLTSVQASSSSSFLADMNVGETLTASGPDAAAFEGLAGKPISISIQMSAENRQRMRLTLHETGAAVPVTAVSVIYDGALYLSTNGGSTFKLIPTSGTIPAQYASENALSYLGSVASVTDDGPATADGVAVERYSAQLDGTKLLALLRSAFSSLQAPAQLRQVFTSMAFKGGSLEVTVDHHGHIITEHGPIDASVDLSALDASLAGTHLDIHELIDAHFQDYGSAVTVTKPAAIATS